MALSLGARNELRKRLLPFSIFDSLGRTRVGETFLISQSTFGIVALYIVAIFVLNASNARLFLEAAADSVTMELDAPSLTSCDVSAEPALSRPWDEFKVVG